MKAKKFILTSLLFLITFFILYLSLFFYQLGMPIRAEWWVKNCYHYKDYRAETILDKKIIVLSGSNAVFGINGKILQEKLGYPVVNLAGHIYLDIDFLYYKLKQHMKKGDIVIIPLEFEHYNRTKKLSNWFTKNMMAWGRSYLDQLTLTQLGYFIFSTDPGTVLRAALLKVINGGKNKKLLPQEIVIDDVKSIIQKNNIKWRGYVHTSLDEFGDFVVDRPVVYHKNKQYLTNNIQLSPHFLTTYKKIVKLIEAHHGTLYLTYPNMMKNIHFNLATKETRQRIKAFEKNLKEHDIEIICNPALFQMERVYYFNNPYHPNKYGGLIYSQNLSDCIKAYMLDPKRKNLSYEKAREKVEILERKYFKDVKK